MPKPAGSLPSFEEALSHQRAQDLVEVIYLQLGSRLGFEFLRGAVEFLLEPLQADLVLLGEFDDTRPGWVHLLESSPQALLTPPRYFYLEKDMLWDLHAGAVAYRADLQKLYPTHPMMAGLGLQSLLLAPLIDAKGKLFGVLGALYQSPVNEPKAAQEVLRRFAVRAAAEMERLHAEQSSRLRQVQLSKAEKLASLNVLVSGLAHEINNPNNLIMFNSDLLERLFSEIQPLLDAHAEAHPDYRLAGLPYAEMRQEIAALFHGIQGGAERIRTLVAGLKDYARIEPSLRNEEVDLNQVGQNALLTAGGRLRLATDEFHWLPASRPLQVLGNRLQLEQVVVNLLSNACDSLTQKSCSIVLRVGSDMASQRHWIQVEDQGEGMTGDQVERLFDPFYTTKRSRGGVGLGLSISHSIVLAHHGQLEFESRPGQGTTATVFLPAVN